MDLRAADISTEIVTRDGTPERVGEATQVVPRGVVLRRKAAAAGASDDRSYRINDLIAAGAMGRVYHGTQLPAGRPVAVKILGRVEDGKMGRFHKRFFREASIASQLSHPNIVTVYDYGEADNGDLFTVMEYLDGKPLWEVMADEGPFPASKVLDLSIQIARALRRAHERGVVHRDLKPANVVVVADGDGGDFVKVLDFGLVKLFDPQSSDLSQPFHEERLTCAGSMVGTPAYAAPEQALGDPVDGRADIYSLGVMMFQMITGRLPFEGETAREQIAQHVTRSPPSFAEVAPAVSCSPELERVVRRCLEKDPDDRYRSMGEVVAALKDLWRDENDDSYGTTQARLLELPPPPAIVDLDLGAPEEDVSRRSHSRRGLWAVAFAAVVALAVGYVAGSWAIGSDGPAAATETAQTDAYKLNPYE